MDIDYLVKMANQIGAFYQTMPNQDEAKKEVVLHLKRFWDPRMRRSLLEGLDTGKETGLAPFVLAAVTSHRTLLD
jgi:formate dehydrogenase subunit delta